MKWRVGQKIVCVKRHSAGIVKKGDSFPIKGLRKRCCVKEIDVGIKSKEGEEEYQTLCHCGKSTSNGKDNTYWLSERLFQPMSKKKTEINL